MTKVQRQSFQKMALGQLNVHIQKDEPGHIPHILHKNVLQKDHGPQYKT